jgi:potassium-transporting ATPase potassium-binding subunit
VLRLIGANESHQQDWKQYSFSLLISNVFMWLATWTIVTLQQHLPLNPDGIGNMEPTLAFNTDLEFHDQHQLAALQR